MADTNQNPAGGGGNPADPANLKVNVPDEVRGGTYSNAVSVNVNSNEVVVDFGYLLPNTQDPEIEVVSRVNMNQKTAESFLNVLGGALEDFKRKQAAAPAPGAAPMPPAPGAPMPPAPAPMGHAPMPAPAPMPPAPGAPMPPPPMPPAPGAPMPPPPMPQNS